MPRIPISDRECAELLGQEGPANRYPLRTVFYFSWTYLVLFANGEINACVVVSTWRQWKNGLSEDLRESPFFHDVLLIAKRGELTCHDQASLSSCDWCGSQPDPIH